MKIGNKIILKSGNKYGLEPQELTVKKLHLENGWKEEHGWIWCDVQSFDKTIELLFIPCEYEVF